MTLCDTIQVSRSVGPKEYKYSEIFYSFQGEGAYTGKLSVWLRFFLCNLQCDGFGQTDPTDPSTYVLPYQEIDIGSIKRIEDLPVFSHGCDSSYSWSSKFKHLQYSDTADTITDKLINLLPNKQFKDPITNNDIHFCITGGESLNKTSQKATIDVMTTFEKKGQLPMFVTFETNGTQPLSAEWVEWAKHYQSLGGEIFFSVSPKLWTVAGEKPEKAIKPEIVKTYYDISKAGQLKFVVRNDDKSFEEFEQTVQLFKQAGVDWQVYGMPVGATKESQETDDTAAVAQRLISKGYHVSGRLHCHIFGNFVGI